MQEVEDEPLFCERAAGIDIGKKMIMVTIRVPSESRKGGRQQETREFGTTRRELLALAGWLRTWQVERTGMESTLVIRGFQDQQSCSAGRTLTYASATRRANAATTRGSGQMGSVVGCLRHGRSYR